MNILLACDRSGGHIYPALCLARHAHQASVFFFTPSAQFKTYIIKKGYRTYGRSLPFRNAFIEGIVRFFEAPAILLRIRPSRVIGFGGRDTFFLIMWARLFSIHTSIFEPNRLMGRANRFLARFVNRIYTAFGDTYQSKKVVHTGIPLRGELVKTEQAKAKCQLGLAPALPVILCCGGSQGSHFINSIFKQILCELKEPVNVIHITGSKEYSNFCEFYGKIDVTARVFSFCQDMHLVYSSADIVITRGGALTLSEVSYYGLPAIVIPYPGAGAHQLENALFYKKEGLVYIFKQDVFSLTECKEALSGLLCSRPRQKAQEFFEKKSAWIQCRKFAEHIFR